MIPDFGRGQSGGAPRLGSILMSANIASPYAARTVAATRAVAVTSVLAMVALCLAWELVWAPLRPGGSLLALKALPLCLPVAGLLKNRLYTYRWLSLALWLYFLEGVVRASSDTTALGRTLAGVEIALSLCLFTACVLHVRLRLRGACVPPSS